MVSRYNLATKIYAKMIARGLILYEKIASLAVVIIFAAFAYHSGGSKESIGSIMMQLPGLFLIWFGDCIGALNTSTYYEIDKKTPGCVAKMLGWIFLSAPLVLPWMFSSVKIKQ